MSLPEEENSPESRAYKEALAAVHRLVFSPKAHNETFGDNYPDNELEEMGIASDRLYSRTRHIQYVTEVGLIEDHALVIKSSEAQSLTQSEHIAQVMLGYYGGRDVGDPDALELGYYLFGDGMSVDLASFRGSVFADKLNELVVPEGAKGLRICSLQQIEALTAELKRLEVLDLQGEI
jgi:hypothetical protein